MGVKDLMGVKGCGGREMGSVCMGCDKWCMEFDMLGWEWCGHYW